MIRHNCIYHQTIVEEYYVQIDETEQGDPIGQLVSEPVGDICNLTDSHIFDCEDCNRYMLQKECIEYQNISEE